MNTPRLTERQRDVLGSLLRRKEPVGSEDNASVLKALRSKGLVQIHYNSAPGYVYYTWALTAAGRVVAAHKGITQ